LTAILSIVQKQNTIGASQKNKNKKQTNKKKQQTNKQTNNKTTKNTQKNLPYKPLCFFRLEQVLVVVRVL
jgi:hypothetical protein